MTLTTVLLILISIAAAAGLSFYQYFYKVGNKTKINLFLAFLRFLAIFGILLLLINPKITRTFYEVQKTPLALVIDNSASMADLKADKTAREIFDNLSANTDLQQKFDIQQYRFDSEFTSADTINFKGKQTNISQVAKNLSDINRNRIFPTVLITDGNQTAGSDFVYSFSPNNKVYPVIAGDTTTFLDLRVMQINVNKYAFHKNKFPAEIFLQYNGTKAVAAEFTIANGNSILHRETVSFSPSKKSVVLNVLLPANSVGLQLYRATISSKESEKNIYNNKKNFAVEVIDQKSEIAIVSAINHPDISALKRAIESNSQRNVSIVKPNAIGSLSNFNVLILYQPTAEFKSVFEANKSAQISTFIITGTNTDFNFLNAYQKELTFKMSGQREDYIASFDQNFNLFALDNIGFENFPPLENMFGNVAVAGNVSILLHSKIRNIESGNPLLTFSETAGKRSAHLLGENIWKWRLQSHIDTKSFEKFDIFIDKTIQYLASTDSKKSLIVTHENFYNSGDPIAITAQFFNKNYEFDEKARLTISVTNNQSKAVKRYDMLRTNSAFQANLDGLAAGKYNFTVKELNSNTSYSGYFEILDFDIEKQFVNPDLARLQQLASETSGIAFMPNQYEELVQKLLKDSDYVAVEKAVVKTLPLIDSMFLLIIIATLFAAEWLIRKYNGML